MASSASFFSRKQQGVSLTSLILLLAVVCMVAVLAMKITPTVTEYFSAKKAIESVKAGGGSSLEMRAAFARQAEVGYITSLKASDLNIVRNGDVADISFAYQKEIHLVGPVSLLIDYSASTNPSRTGKPAVP